MKDKNHRLVPLRAATAEGNVALGFNILGEDDEYEW
jgi:hypothetical protein